MEALYEFCPDAVLRRSAGGWVFSNLAARRHVEVDARAASAVAEHAAGASEKAWGAALEKAEGWERSAFTNSAGLLADPSGLGPRKARVGGAELFAALRRAWILQDRGGKAYREFLGPKTSLLDRGHLGTFHQNIGQHLLLDLRVKDTWRWWHDQKFSPDGLSVRPGPYKWVQEHFFDGYFGAADVRGKAFLDFACGNGHYAARLAKLGAKVTGIDTSPELVAIARRNHGAAAEFLQPAGERACLDALREMPDGGFDAVYVGDALLFFFMDIRSGAAKPLLPELLRQFRRLLKRDGRLYLMEPNGAFWLAPALGDPARPLAVVSEYREPLYNVAPTADRVTELLDETGFSLLRLSHPRPDPKAAAQDPARHAYASAFPLWDFYVCRPKDGL